MRRAFQDFATGRFTKHEVRKNVNALGLTTRRGKPVPSQTFDAMLRNRAYIAQLDVPEFGISRRGDFEPLITEGIFFRVQAILDGRCEVTAPKQRNDPQKAIREKLDSLDQAFLFERTIDVDTYDRHRDKLREELTLIQMDRHSSELEELDVEGILAFAERVLPSASNLWVQSRSLRSSGCSRCSFRTEFASTGRSLLEPVQPFRFSTT